MAYQNNCLFCAIADGSASSVSVFEDDTTVAFMDIRPASRGHTLVVPRAHFTDILDMPEPLLHASAINTQRLAIAIDAALSPSGFRISQFNGAAAGQTVFHYHVHIVPVYGGRSTPSHGRSVSIETDLQAVAERIRHALADHS